MDARIFEIRVALPGKVEKIDLSAQMVDVKPQVKNRFVDEDGMVTVEDLPVIPSVPISWPRGGGFFLTLPIAVGDTGLIVCADRSIDQWRKSGIAGDPIDLRTHNWQGAVFLPGLHDSKNPLSDAHGSNAVIGKDGGTQIHIKDGAITLGEETPTPNEKVLLGTIFRTAQATMNTALQTGFTAMATGFTALGTGWTAGATFGATFAADAATLGTVAPNVVPAAAVWTTACSVAATACTVAATACSTVATAIGTFETTAGSNQDFQSNIVSVKR